VEIIVPDTLAAQRAILAAPEAARFALARERILEPLRGFWSTFLSRMPHLQGASDEALAQAAIQMVGLFKLDADAPDHLAALDQLADADALGTMRDALERGVRAFADGGHTLPFDRVTGAVLLADRDNDYIMRFMRGYTGAGMIPGYVIVALWPTGYTLPRLGAAAAHEFHHNVRLSYAPFTMDISVGEYIVLEGLAESFAAALYGHDLVGPWVTSLTPEELAQSKAVIGGALNVRGFNNVRPYLFGDPAASFSGYEPIGLPFAAGYTIGFHVVQAYLARTGRTIVDATFTPAAEIIAESGYFE
jgi:uncharacterized protein YjaZ